MTWDEHTTAQLFERINRHLNTVKRHLSDSDKPQTKREVEAIQGAINNHIGNVIYETNPKLLTTTEKITLFLKEDAPSVMDSCEHIIRRLRYIHKQLSDWNYNHMAALIADTAACMATIRDRIQEVR